MSAAGAPRLDPERSLLAIDSGSPLVSVAVGSPAALFTAPGAGSEIVVRSVEMRRSSQRLIPLVEDALTEAGVRLDELGGVLALSGPGSFTGLRVGLATVLGWHQALGLPAAVLPTLRVLASLAPPGARTVAAAVDALRGEWFVQRFTRGGAGAGAGGRPGAPAADGEATLLSTGDLAHLPVDARIGFGLSRSLGIGPGSVAAGSGEASAARGPLTVEPGPLARAALELAALDPPSWDPAGLTRPRYLRPPAIHSPSSSASGSRR